MFRERHFFKTFKDVRKFFTDNHAIIVYYSKAILDGYDEHRALAMMLHKIKKLEEIGVHYVNADLDVYNANKCVYADSQYAYHITFCDYAGRIVIDVYDR